MTDDVFAETAAEFLAGQQPAVDDRAKQLAEHLASEAAKEPPKKAVKGRAGGKKGKS